MIFGPKMIFWVINDFQLKKVHSDSWPLKTIIIEQMSCYPMCPVVHFFGDMFSRYLFEEQPERDVLDDLVGDVLGEVPELELELEAVAAVARVDLLLEDLLVHVQPVLLVVAVDEVQAEVPVLKTMFNSNQYVMLIGYLLWSSALSFKN